MTGQDDNRPRWEEELGAGVEREEAPEADVAAQLWRTKDGLPRATLGNLMIVLEQDTRWVGRLKLDRFAGLVKLDGRELREADGIRIAKWCERTYHLAVDTRKVREAVLAVADDNGYHPVLEYLDGLTWDGGTRVERFLCDYIGAEDTPLNRAISRCFLVACVARVREPGCKVDTVLILVGDQGRFKSTAFELLAGDWFSDTKIDPGDKDAYQSLPGRWIYELAEMETWGRHAWGRIKAFLSSRIDRYRPSYGRIVESFPRQNVFVGSTNQKEFLADPTGSRRFHPVDAPRHADRDAIRRDRDQLWAEAEQLYRTTRRWWLDEVSEQQLREESEPFQVSDPWDAEVWEWGRLRAPFPIEELLTHLGYSLRDQDQAVGNRVANILTRLKFTRDRPRLGNGARPRLWFRPGLDPKAWAEEQRQRRSVRPGPGVGQGEGGP